MLIVLNQLRRMLAPNNGHLEKAILQSKLIKAINGVDDSYGYIGILFYMQTLVI